VARGRYYLLGERIINLGGGEGHAAYEAFDTIGTETCSSYMGEAH